ncbi:MAG: hypothetical protein IJS88_00095 [Alphaproteobacteria bacterium]|nr:hypothetical protein [Alphaproteobacteria bacterium]
MNSGYLELMWQNAEEWRLIAALLSGVVVGLIYFYSLRWSINHYGKLEHKVRLYAVVALCRITLFFGVLILIGHRNIAVILLYVLAFFLTKVGIIWVEKNRYITGEAKDLTDKK